MDFYFFLMYAVFVMLSKKILLYFFLIFIIINILSFLIIIFKFGENLFNKEDYLKKKISYQFSLPQTYIHPYMGQIDLNNKKSGLNTITDENLFFDIFNPEYVKNEDAFKILILGSTQALLFNKDEKSKKLQENIIAKKLQTFFPEKKFVVYNGATKSSKQPQHLFKLYYLNLLGMNFDAVIEIGGVQEITHPIIKNYKLKEEGIYPRRYSDTIAYMSGDFSCIEKSNSHSKKITYLPVYEVYSLYIIKSCMDTIYKKNLMPWKNEKSFKERDSDDLVKSAVKIWRNASIQTEEYSKQKGFFYLQVILPNKYLNKKEYSDEEKNYLEEMEYTNVIKNFYELKNFKDVKLRNSLDLRDIFINTKQTVYTKDCCDFNNYGISIISNSIVDYLKKNLQVN